jgi:type II secretory pathway component GspD/PulD (secretin)
VNADGDVTLRVHPVVSTITSIDANNLPQTSTREAETTLVVKNGETIVLGGLIRDEMTKTVNEVPILSKLPLVGELFRNTTTSGRKSEILVFITPKIGDGTPASAVAVPGK